MGTDSLFDLIFFGAFFSVLAWFGWSMIRHRGFKGAMFDARIPATAASARGISAPL